MTETPYSQKYLDQQFKSIVTILTEMKADSKADQLATNKTLQEILLEVGQLKSTDIQQSKEIHATHTKIENLEKQHQSEYKTLYSAINKNNYFSVKGVGFVVAIFTIMMFAFLLNGTALLQSAL